MHSLPAHLLAIAGAALGTPWLAWHEARLLSKGTPLDPGLLDWARPSGIANPRKARFLSASVIPLPAPMFVRRFLDKRGFPCIHLAGLSLRNGIYLSDQFRDPNETVKHELIHTRKYQQAESIFEFLRRYLFQCLTDGYSDCEMEREARNESRR